MHTYLNPSFPVYKNRLPNELLRVIFEHVISTKDLVILCRVSRLFRLEAERQLYTSINVGPDLTFQHSIPPTKDSKDEVLDVKRQIMLFRSIKASWLSEIVINFQVRLTSTYPCNSFSPKRVFLCPCDIIDSGLGEALRGLKNLAHLGIDCRLCTRHGKTTRHNFLNNLQTKSLGVLSIVCNCSFLSSRVSLQKPAFKTVHTLELSSSPNASIFILVEKNIALPELRTLDTTTPEFLITMVAKRPIHTISVDTWDHNMHDAAIKSIHTGSLQRLSVTSFIDSNFIYVISPDIQPYVNLHQLGRLKGATTQVSASSMCSAGYWTSCQDIDHFRIIENFIYVAQALYFGYGRHRKRRLGKTKGLSLEPRVSSGAENASSKSIQSTITPHHNIER